MTTVSLVAVFSSLAMRYPMHRTYLERLVSLQLVEESRNLVRFWQMRRVLQFGFVPIARAGRIPFDKRRGDFLCSSVSLVDTVFFAPGVEETVDLFQVI